MGAGVPQHNPPGRRSPHQDAEPQPAHATRCRLNPGAPQNHWPVRLNYTRLVETRDRPEPSSGHGDPGSDLAAMQQNAAEPTADIRESLQLTTSPAPTPHPTESCAELAHECQRAHERPPLRTHTEVLRCKGPGHLQLTLKGFREK